MRLPFKPGLVIGTDIASQFRFLVPNGSDRNLQSFRKLTRLILKDSERQEFVRRFPFMADGEDEKAARNQRSGVQRGMAEFIAGRWAAKEAAKKAWGASILTWKHLEIIADRGANPYIVCDTGAQSNDPSTVTSQEGQCSISHDGAYAIATVLAETLHADIVTELQRQKAEARSYLESKPSLKSEDEEGINTPFSGSPEVDGYTNKPFSAPSEDLGKILDLGQR